MDRDVRGDGGVALGELLEDGDCVGTAQAAAAEVLAHVDAAEAELAGTVQRFPREDVLLVALGGMGRELGVGEVADGLEDRLALLGGGGDCGHCHRGSLWASRVSAWWG
ncbi:hypothetical protein D3C73_1356730 [compost metagenome]